MFLKSPAGETGSSNIVKMAREGLGRELVASLHRAVTTTETVRRLGLRVKTNGDFTPVYLSISPLAAVATTAVEVPLYLLLLDSVAPAADSRIQQPAPVAAGPEPDARVELLQNELRNKEKFLQAANEEMEASNEELTSSYEEMQSVNEELQSANEKLETSKEELRSLNEELATVDAELHTKVSGLSQANNDMNNLLAGTGIGTVFVDHHLRILRFTPTSTAIINLIPGDMGRPIGDIVANLFGYDKLEEDVQAVLDSLIPQSKEVRTKSGLWYSLRILPYRTLENAIEGAVLTFVAITESVRIREALEKANSLARLAVIVQDAHDAVKMQNLDGHILARNPGASRMYGCSEAQALTMNVPDLIPTELRQEALAVISKLSQAEVLAPCLTQRIIKAGNTISVSLITTALVNDEGNMYGISTTERVSVAGSKPAGQDAG